MQPSIMQSCRRDSVTESLPDGLPECDQREAQFTPNQRSDIMFVTQPSAMDVPGNPSPDTIA